MCTRVSACVHECVGMYVCVLMVLLAEKIAAIWQAIFFSQEDHKHISVQAKAVEHSLYCLFGQDNCAQNINMF